MADVLHRAAIGDVVAERREQIDVHGFTLAHDMGHLPVALALAGASYLNTAIDALNGIEHPASAVPDTWPFEDGWHPQTARSNLVKAAAIIWAAIDRIDGDAA